MPSAVRRVPALALLIALVALATPGGLHPRLALAQPKAPEPTADEVKALAERFRAEREEATKGKFPAESLARADDLVKRAEVALKADNFKTAARYYRDARWQLPFLPANLPPHVSRVFGESRMRHADRVNAVSYSADGKTLASASRDGTVRIWDLGNGREIVAYRGHADQPEADTVKGANVLKVADVAFHPTEKIVASVGGTQVHLWDSQTGKQLKVLVTLEKADKPLRAIAFSPDGKTLAVGGDDGILRVYEVESGKNTFTGQPRNARIERVAFSPKGKLIGVADMAGLVAVYAPGAGNPMPMSTPVTDNNQECYGVGFTADGAGVFSCGKDGKARLTAGPNPDGSNAGNTATRLRDFLGHSGSVNTLAVTPDGKLLLTGGDDRTVRVWEVTSGKQLRSFQGHMQKVTAVSVRGDGRQVASASEDGAIRLWDLSTSDDHRALSEATEPVWAVAISPDGKKLAAAGGDKTIRIYDPDTGKLETTLTGHTAGITSLAFFPDNNRLLSAGGDRIVKVWDVANKKVLTELKGHELPILAVSLGGDGKLAVSGAADGSTRGWDAESGKQLWSWPGKSAVCAVALRRDAKLAAVGLANGTLTMLDVSGGTPKEVASQSAHVAGVAWAAFGPDGTNLATVGGDGAVQIWTVAEIGAITRLAKFDGQPKVGSASGYFPLSAVAFSPDGRLVATAGADMVVRVWDIQTKAEVRGLRAHTDWATAVAFSPDSRLLISAAADKTVRVFELAPQETSSSAGHLLAVKAVGVSPDGKTVATAAVDQTIRLWDLAAGREGGTLIGNADEPIAVTFLGNDALVMGGRRRSQDSGTVYFWGTKPGRLAKTLTTGEVYNVQGTADGAKVGVWSARPVIGDKPIKNSTYEVYAAKGELLVSLPDKGRDVRAATFTPDLAWVVAGDETGTVQIWDLAKKERVGGDWAWFANSYIDIGITPDKKHLVGVDTNGLVKVADIATRATLASATAHKNGVAGLLVSPKGDSFITIGADREVKAWSLAGDLKELKEVRSWKLPVVVNGAAYTPDGKSVVTANADGTAYVLEMP